MARCKICHRTLSNPDHIAAGMGPICAQKAARRASVTDRTAESVAGYSRERYERITRGLAQCAAMLETAERAYRLVLLDVWATPDARAEAQRLVALRIHWLTRVDAMERRARRLLAPVARVA